MKRHLFVITFFCFAILTKANPCNPVLWYADTDNDGYGDPTVFVSSCVQPVGYVADNTDCDDSNPYVNPGETEVCNDIDDNCNSIIDNDAIDATFWYTDADTDGYGDLNNSGSYACSQPPNTSLDNTDCDDNDFYVNPGQIEICNGLDDDCNGTVDDNAADALSWFADADADSYGDLTDPGVLACTAPPNHVADNTDCDDSNPNIYPGATEVCNFLDDDCNSITDDNAVDASLWYTDYDGDTYGDMLDPGVLSCTQVDGTVANNQDCDDGTSAIYPGAIEICNGFDDDCNGAIDDNSADASLWYTDADDDSFGDALSSGFFSCSQQPNSSDNNLDCDDTNGAVFPGATEVCNDVDDDCNSIVDDSPIDGGLWYEDKDGDTYGSATATPIIACYFSSGYSGNNQDCDDENPAVSPDATEVCNGYDDNCDGLTDDDDPAVTGQLLWYTDADNDGYGDINDPGSLACSQITGTTSNATDCNDADPTIHPNAVDICDGIDQDCNGIIDDGCVTAVAAYQNNRMDVQVFPNPAGDYLNVLVKGAVTGYLLKLMDFKGRVILNRVEEINNLIQLDLTAVSKGIYILYISTGKESRQVKVVIE